MPRNPTSYQFELFAKPQGGGGLKTPPWRTLPVQTRQTITTLIARLILDHADEERAGDRREAARHDV